MDAEEMAIEMAMAQAESVRGLAAGRGPGVASQPGAANGAAVCADNSQSSQGKRKRDHVVIVLEDSDHGTGCDAEPNACQSETVQQQQQQH